METAEYVIGTPVQSRSPRWRRRKVTPDSLSSSPPMRGKRPATTDAAASPIRPSGSKHTHKIQIVQHQLVSESQDAVISQDSATIFMRLEQRMTCVGTAVVFRRKCVGTAVLVRRRVVDTSVHFHHKTKVGLKEMVTEVVFQRST